MADTENAASPPAASAPDAPLPVIMPDAPAVIMPEPVKPRARDDVEVHLSQAFNLRVPEGNGRYKLVPLRRGKNVIDRGITTLPEWHIVKRLIVAPPDDLRTVSATRSQALAASISPRAVEMASAEMSEVARAQQLQARRILDAQKQAEDFEAKRASDISSGIPVSEEKVEAVPEPLNSDPPPAPNPDGEPEISNKPTVKPPKIKGKLQPEVEAKLAGADTPVSGMK